MLRAPQRHCRYHLIHYSSRLCELPPAILQCVSFSLTSTQRTSLFHTGRLLYPANLLKTVCSCGSLFLGSNGSFSSMAGAPSSRTVTVEVPEEGNLNSTRLNILLKKLEELDIDGHGCTPGQYNSLLCPLVPHMGAFSYGDPEKHDRLGRNFQLHHLFRAPDCEGGDFAKKSLSLFITEDGNSAYWICFRGQCGWKGNVNAIADVKNSNKVMNWITKVKKRELTEQMLALEPLCNELLDYFAARMISAETLRRNAVMQKRFGDEFFIAFTYRQNGNLVHCKYRDINKKFWQERNTEKIFYGLDDIRNATDVIIVEGEIDKLSMEEAGFLNCVSVPDGAPPRISTKDVPTPDKDTGYQYLWNCKEYLEKGSRIILATDADAPGQALAEEVARRVGREKCWRVKWPRKNATEVFKDANEVLVHLGPEALREVIQDAGLYPIPGLFHFRDYFQEIDNYYHGGLAD